MTRATFWKQVFLHTIQNIKLYVGAAAKLLLLTVIIYGVGFWALDIHLAWLMAIGISLVALLPVIGAGVVFIPWILIEWLQGDTQVGWWLFAIYLGVELLTEILQPLLIGKDLKVPFWLPIVVTLMCTIAFNLFGVMVAGIVIPLISAYSQVKGIERAEIYDDK
ncbi:AI-2E family transporter [Aerococcus urinaeequi]|uniref:AI-2E family transporter n=1 Tax=Aerococcus urinaeequi TaxID=51665 RepID=A0A7M1KVC3_9LACT|nr:AI-2E family transporter [Aerococcus urinaeequi]QOQ79848.1 AI-2E family transporter [Aerococcus urinaeequi]